MRWLLVLAAMWCGCKRETVVVLDAKAPVVAAPIDRFEALKRLDLVMQPPGRELYAFDSGKRRAHVAWYGATKGDQEFTAVLFAPDATAVVGFAIPKVDDVWSMGRSHVLAADDTTVSLYSLDGSRPRARYTVQRFEKATAEVVERGDAGVFELKVGVVTYTELDGGLSIH